MKYYFDYNATAPVRDVVCDVVAESLGCIGNPSSIHAHGREARKRVEQARETIATVLGLDPIEITFTSGATEANNMVVHGHTVSHIIVSAIEHPSILEAVKKSDKTVHVLPVDREGVVKTVALEDTLKHCEGKALVSIMAVNNETGVIQPIKKIASLCRQYGAEFHCDAVQALGKIDMKDIADNADYISLSGHKVGGPMGIGALVYNHHRVLTKQVFGGGQERRRRAGTENVSGIAGFAAAVFQSEKERSDKQTLWLGWQKDLQNHVHEICPRAVIVGENVSRVSQTLQIVLPGVSAQKQLMFMDMKGISVSSGAACSSGSVQPSHVLLAQGYGELADNAIRISWGHSTKAEDIATLMTTWEKMVHNFYKN